MGIELIYCAARSARFAQIAIEHGFLYGAQLPAGTLYYPIFFADNDWKKPNRERYMAALAQHRPHIASVLDLERHEQLEEVLDWAEEAARHCEVVMIIPKAFGIISRLPRHINGAEVRLGYSVPTKFGGTEVPVWEFADWPVHLLGGQPHKQMALANYLNVVSTDGNYAQLKAIKFGEIWRDGAWMRLRDVEPVEYDAPYVAFAHSCANIMQAWQRIVP